MQKSESWNRIERLERLVAVLMEANKITGSETKSATLN